MAWPPIKAEDSTALNKFAIFLSSCKNALAGSQYASKFDQPANIQKLIFKLPFNTRERWRRSADDIMERQLRPVEFNDLVAFMDREARIATNPVFGNISGNDQPFFNSRERKPSQPVVSRSSKPKTTTFATQVKTNQSMNSEKNPCADLAVLMFRPLCAYFANRTTLLKIVIYLDGSHTRSALNFYQQRDSALAVCLKSMLQGFALKEKSVKFQTALVSIPQFLIHLMFVRSP